MKRGLILAAVGLLLFAAAVYAGFLVGARVAPARLRDVVAARLSEALHARVTLGQVGLDLSLRRLALRVDIRQAEAVFGGPERERARATVPRLEVDLDPLALLVGRLRTRRLVATGPHLLLAPPESEEASRARAGAAGLVAEGVGALFQLDARARSLRHDRCLLPIAFVEVSGASVDLQRGQQAIPVLSDAHLMLRCSALRRLNRGDVEATLAAPGTAGAALSAGFSNSSRHLQGRLAVSGLDLGNPGGALREAIPPVWRGRLDGTLSWDQSEDSPLELSLELSGEDVKGSLAVGAKELRIDLARPELSLHLAAAAQHLLLRQARLEAGGATLHAKGSLASGTPDSARLSLALTLDALDVARLRRLPPYLPEPLAGRLGAILDRLASGSIERVSADLDTTPRGLEAMLRGGILSRPGALTLAASVKDASIIVRHSAPEQRIEDLNGSLSFAGDRLLLSGVQARYQGEPLPRLDAEVSGISSIRSLDELHCEAPDAVPALPGVPALERWIRSRREKPERQTWQRVAIQADWIAHPALLCTLHDVDAQVVPEAHGIAVQVKRGLWAGVPLDATGRYVETPAGADVSVDVHLGTPARAPPKAVDRSAPWMQGRFQADATSLGHWRVRGAKGDFRADGGVLQLLSSTLFLDPGGRVEGHLSVDLGRADPLEFRTAIQVPKVPLADVTAAAGQQRAGLTGTLYGAAAAHGHLVLGDPPLEHAQGTLSLSARNGHVRQDLPVVLALVVASRPFAPASRHLLDYRAIDLVGRVSDGWLRSETLTAEGRTLRVAASVDVRVAKPNPLKGVVGLFFFPRLDSLIQQLPLLNRVILGSNGNLMGAYFSLHGTWDRPSTRIIPIRSLASSTPVVGGLSDFVIGGIRRIEEILTARNTKPSIAPAKEGS